MNPPAASRRRAADLFRRALLSACTAGSLTLPVASYAQQQPPRQVWAVQIGTEAGDVGEHVSADAGGVYVAGSTSGSLGGPASGGNNEPGFPHNPDAYLLRYDRNGNRVWGAQIGDVYTDNGFGVFSDPVTGGAYLTGSTGSNLDGTNRGGYDQFLARYDSAGGRLWTRQIGTGVNDRGLSVSADALGSVFVGGNTVGSLAATNPGINKTDATLSRYDGSGNLAWTRQWGQDDNDSTFAVAADGRGGVFAAGDTRTFLNGNDRGSEATIRHYDRDGHLTWSRTLGVALSNDQALGISPDGHGGIYVSGRTEGNLAATNPTPVILDPFLARYDADGNLLWTRQLPLPGQDFPQKVTADGMGGVLITGSVIRELPGHTNQGNYDGYVVRYDEAGNLLWTHQFGTSLNDSGVSLSADGLGAVYLTGYTEGSLFGPNRGGLDAFLVRFDVVPEPSGVMLVAGTLATVVMRRRRGA
jgi:hypothetical protein